MGLAFLVDNIQSTQTAAGRNATVTAAAIAPVVDDLRTYCFNNRLWPDFTKLPTPEDARAQAPDACGRARRSSSGH